MATRFIQTATKQVAPVYAQQTQALKAQIPAINQLYSSLIQGLEGTRQTENMNILEGASGRGILRSTIPVDQQVGLEQSLLQQRGQYGAQQAQDIAGIQNQLGQVGVQRFSAINDLAQALQSQDLARRQFQLDKAGQQQQLALQRKVANRDYQLQLQALGIA